MIPKKQPAHHTADFFIDESEYETGIKPFAILFLILYESVRSY
jgi:hypothetical protein